MVRLGARAQSGGLGEDDEIAAVALHVGDGRPPVLTGGKPEPRPLAEVGLAVEADRVGAVAELLHRLAVVLPAAPVMECRAAVRGTKGRVAAIGLRVERSTELDRLDLVVLDPRGEEAADGEVGLVLLGAGSPDLGVEDRSRSRRRLLEGQHDDATVDLRHVHRRDDLAAAGDLGTKRGHGEHDVVLLWAGCVLVSRYLDANACVNESKNNLTMIPHTTRFVNR